MGRKDHFIRDDRQDRESSKQFIRRAMREQAETTSAPPMVGNEPDHPGCSCSGRCSHG